MVKGLLGSLEILFFNNFDIKICINLLFDDFRNNCIVFFFFLDLDNSGELSLQAIYNVLNLFFFKYSLSEINLLRPIFKFSKFLFFIFMVITLDSYFEEKKKE